MVMEALCAGWGEPAQCIVGDPPEDENPFAIYGQIWGAERLLPDAIKTGRPFWYIDNGYWKPGRGSRDGYYRISYRGMSSVLLENCPADDRRARLMTPRMKPWRKTGKHILFALPGVEYGSAIGLDMPGWVSKTHVKLKARTDRPIVLRTRDCNVPLVDHFKDCWALVTHSSNISTEAVLAGIPVFVASKSHAAPVGNVTLDNLETPLMPGRELWWRSLMCQQFTPKEMSDGTAYRLLNLVRRKVDGCEMSAGGR